MSSPETVHDPSDQPAPLDGYLHSSLIEGEESIRRGRFHIRFGLLGGFMAMVYASLFLVLGYDSGSIILGAGGLAIALVPWIVRKTGNLSLTGHLYGGTLMLAVTSLCVLDGGRESVMFAWLAAIPVTALLLMTIQQALWWCSVCLVTAGTFIYLDLQQIEFINASALNHDPAVSSASYLGLILYLGFLGLLFEKGRLEASERSVRATDKLSKANEELLDLNHQKNEFLNIAAHDLKNPLSIICAYADLLGEVEKPDAAEIRLQGKEILRSGNHMLDIIRNILDVRAIEDGKRNLCRVKCDTREIVSDLVNGYRKFADRKQIQLINSVGDGCPNAWADPGAFRQILDNLISNAIKYTPSRGVVRVTVKSSPETVTIRVSDTGPGLSEEDQKKLWGKFTRLTPRPTAKEHSTGLGLWIVRRLATEMDGNTFCLSTEGLGSMFAVQLPVWTESRPTSEREDDEEAGRTAFNRLLAEIETKCGSDVALSS